MAAETGTNFQGQYSLQEQLGKGSYAVVHRCIHQTSRENLAVKIVDKTKATASQLSDLNSEIAILRELRHPGIIQLKDCISSSSTVYIIMELISGGDLFRAITRLTSYSENIASTLLFNVLAAMEYMHREGIAHRDLKPDNILLAHPLPPVMDTSDPAVVSKLTSIKLADFGFASRSDGENMTKCCGTPYYIAPEVLNCGLYKTSGPYGKQCDMWSLGVVSYVLLCGFPPFQASKRSQLFKLIVKGHFKFPSNTVWDKIGSEAKDFIKKLLTVDHKARLTPRSALRHTWVEMHNRNSTTHLPKVQRNLQGFNARCKFKGAVYGIEAFHRLLYLQKCAEHGMRPNSGIVSALDDRSGMEENEDLDLSKNYVGRKGVAPVMNVVEAKRKLKKLVLKNNEIENTSVDTIVRTLAKHPSITHIDLSQNPLSRGAAKKLMHLVQVNPNIQRVDLEGTMIHSDKIRQINDLLDRNRGLRAAAAAAANPAPPPPAASTPLPAIAT